MLFFEPFQHHFFQLFTLQTVLPAFAPPLNHHTTAVDSRSVGVSPAPPSTTNRSFAYTYDKLYCLTRETIIAPSGMTVPIMGSIFYTHNQVGNRLYRTSSNTLLQSFLPNQSQSNNANDSAGKMPAPSQAPLSSTPESENQGRQSKVAESCTFGPSAFRPPASTRLNHRAGLNSGPIFRCSKIANLGYPSKSKTFGSLPPYLP